MELVDRVRNNFKIMTSTSDHTAYFFGANAPTAVSTDLHLRYLINTALLESRDTSILGNIRPIVSNAMVIADDHFDEFLTNDLSCELLVMLAEVCMKVPAPITEDDLQRTERVLDLYDRCKP